MPEEKLVQVHCFKMNDAPNAKEPSKDEVVAERPNKQLGVMKVFQESRMKELRMENQALKKLREKENQLRDLFQAMTADVEWNQPLEISVETQEQDTAEEKQQQQREMQVFAVYYVKDHMIPPNPPELETKKFTEPINNQRFEMKLSKAYEEKTIIKPAPIPEPNKSYDMALALNLLQTLVKSGSEAAQWKKELPKNYKTVPCKVYHGPMGHCSKGEFCHFIHDPSFAGREIPTELWRGSSARFPASRSTAPAVGMNWVANFYQGGRPNVRFNPRPDLYIPHMNETTTDSLYMSREQNN